MACPNRHTLARHAAPPPRTAHRKPIPIKSKMPWRGAPAEQPVGPRAPQPPPTHPHTQTAGPQPAHRPRRVPPRAPRAHASQPASPALRLPRCRTVILRRILCSRGESELVDGGLAPRAVLELDGVHRARANLPRRAAPHAAGTHRNPGAAAPVEGRHGGGWVREMRNLSGGWS